MIFPQPCRLYKNLTINLLSSKKKEPDEVKRHRDENYEEDHDLSREYLCMRLSYSGIPINSDG